MDAQRLMEEFDLLRGAFAAAEHLHIDDADWIRIPGYAVPDGWSARAAEVVFNVPLQPRQAPYAFYVRPQLRLADDGTPQNYTAPATTPWGSDFAMFSWAPAHQWIPKADVRHGDNLLNFARSFADRFKELV